MEKCASSQGRGLSSLTLRLLGACIRSRLARAGLLVWCAQRRARSRSVRTYAWGRVHGLGSLTFLLLVARPLSRPVRAALLGVWCAPTDLAGIEGKSAGLTAKGPRSEVADPSFARRVLPEQAWPRCCPRRLLCSRGAADEVSRRKGTALCELVETDSSRARRRRCPAAQALPYSPPRRLLCSNRPGRHRR